MHGDNTVHLVVLCAEKPTTSLLKRVVTELPIQLKKVTEEHKYTVTMAPVEGAVMVSDGTITVKISLTSPLLREGKCWWFLAGHRKARCSTFCQLLSISVIVNLYHRPEDKSRFRATSFNDTFPLCAVQSQSHAIFGFVLFVFNFLVQKG